MMDFGTALRCAAIDVADGFEDLTSEQVAAIYLAVREGIDKYMTPPPSQGDSVR